jgi:DNA polymerase I-like protein with 3'-5' exonuclease and polymerase domains
MDIVTIDFETYWSKDFSLSKMTTEEYIRDPNFEVIGVGIKVNNQEPDFYSGADFNGFLNAIDYSDKAILCHNTVFDGAILSWLYGIKPKLWLDTMSMARPLHAMTVGGSLKALTQYYELGAKGDEVMRTQGMRRKDFTLEQMEAFAEYCLTDVDLTYKLFRKLSKGFPKEELLVIDQTIRMYTEPKFVVDAGVLEQHLTDIKDRKERLLAKLGGEERAKKILMSNNKFAELLRSLGVEPPTKTSLTTGKETYAFAKTDTEFTALTEHPRPAVRAVVEARLGTKSTIEETRANRLLDIADRGPLPVHLSYYGAHTGRFSGGAGSKINLQNLPRGGALRRSLAAPDGHVVVACDSSQIEARMVAYLAGQDDLVEAFAEGRDVYCEFASDVYGRPITKADKVERFVGKTCILGLGYGMGATKFAHTLASGALSVKLDSSEAEKIVRLYRNKYHRIAALWTRFNHALGPLTLGQSGQITDDITFDEEGIILPNGMRLRYPALRQQANGYEYINDARVYRKYVRDKMAGGGDELTWTKIYGGKLVENYVQAAARIVVSEQMVRIGRRYPVALQVHDEVVCVVPETEAEACKEHVVKVMSTPPSWAPNLPVACEADAGINYGEVK